MGLFKAIFSFQQDPQEKDRMSCLKGNRFCIFWQDIKSSGCYIWLPANSLLCKCKEKINAGVHSATAKVGRESKAVELECCFQESLAQVLINSILEYRHLLYTFNGSKHVCFPQQFFHCLTDNRCNDSIQTEI